MPCLIFLIYKVSGAFPSKNGSIDGSTQCANAVSKSSAPLDVRMQRAPPSSHWQQVCAPLSGTAAEQCCARLLLAKAPVQYRGISDRPPSHNHCALAMTLRLLCPIMSYPTGDAKPTYCPSSCKADEAHTSFHATGHKRIYANL